MQVALVLNGDPPSGDDLKLLAACQAIVCADGAAGALLRAEIPPTVIVGDLDSLSPEAYKWADALNIPVERHPPTKDKTDGELALERALRMNPKSLVILGGHGGRMAMFLANLRLLRTAHEKGLEARMNGKGESIRFLTAGAELVLAGRTGSTLNVLAIDGEATVALEGTAFDAPEVQLGARSARGCSNRIEKDGAKVRCLSGTVLVILERKQPKEYTIL